MKGIQITVIRWTHFVIEDILCRFGLVKCIWPFPAAGDWWSLKLLISVIQYGFSSCGSYVVVEGWNWSSPKQPLATQLYRSSQHCCNSFRDPKAPLTHRPLYARTLTLTVLTIKGLFKFRTWCGESPRHKIAYLVNVWLECQLSEKQPVIWF